MSATLLYLLNGEPQEGSPYWCYDKERPVNGIPVHHNHSNVQIAQTEWKHSKAGEKLVCGYAITGEAIKDSLCAGCMHNLKYN